MRLSFLSLPFGHRRPRLVPECGMFLAFAAMEDLPSQETGSVPQVGTNFLGDVLETHEVLHLLEGSLHDRLVLDRIERACRVH